MATGKEPVRLRERRTPSGLISLYLDIYVSGRRRYEYLRLYLVPERTREDKRRNAETRQMAEAVRAKRVVEVRNGLFGFMQRSPDIGFYDYFRRETEKRRHEGTRALWRMAERSFRLYDNRSRLRLRDITPEWIQGYINHATGLKQNTKLQYIAKLSACLNMAVREGLLEWNPVRNVKRGKMEETKRMYLTVDELRRMVETRYGRTEKEGQIRRAFLFSCLTGLRISDIAALTWGEVSRNGAYTRITFRQKKTGGQEYLDITDEAVRLMGERGKDTDAVFGRFASCDYMNRYIQRWADVAGVDKHISFHCGRHTFAVMMLELGTDIYTVSKLLGHRELSTTQIYARVVDWRKQEAVSRIPSILVEKEVE